MADEIKDVLTKVMMLKEFSLTNGYEVEDAILSDLNMINQKFLLEGKLNLEDSSKLDKAIAGLTRVTFPVTLDTLSTERESKEYKRFKKVLFGTGIVALPLAMVGFFYSTQHTSFPIQLANSILAISLGLLGAVIYSLFNVLRVIPPRAFNPNDEYSNYARLLLGVLLGWIFYFMFAQEAFENLQNFLVTDGKDKENSFSLLIPFIAGYSTKFVIAVLEKMITALEIAIGIEDKRDVSTNKAISSRNK